MDMKPVCRHLLVLSTCVLLLNATQAAESTFRVVTYNVENYLDRDTETRRAKPAEAKAKVHDMLLSRGLGQRRFMQAHCPGLASIQRSNSWFRSSDICLIRAASSARSASGRITRVSDIR